MSLLTAVVMRLGVVKNSTRITRLKEQPSLLALAMAVVPSQEHKSKLEVLQEPKRSDLIFGLRVEISRLGVGFEGINWPLERITIADVLALDDSLTEFHFHERILLLRRAKVLISEIISRELRETLDINAVESTPDKEGYRTK